MQSVNTLLYVLIFACGCLIGVYRIKKTALVCYYLLLWSLNIMLLMNCILGWNTLHDPELMEVCKKIEHSEDLILFYQRFLSVWTGLSLAYVGWFGLQVLAVIWWAFTVTFISILRCRPYMFRRIFPMIFGFGIRR